MNALVGFLLGIPTGLVIALLFVALTARANEWEEKND